MVKESGGQLCDPAEGQAHVNPLTSRTPCWLLPAERSGGKRANALKLKVSLQRRFKGHAVDPETNLFKSNTNIVQYNTIVSPYNRSS